jgi:hypothetical protein
MDHASVSVLDSMYESRLYGRAKIRKRRVCRHQIQRLHRRSSNCAGWIGSDPGIDPHSPGKSRDRIHAQ